MRTIKFLHTMSISVRLRKTAKLLPFLMHRKCAQGERYQLQNKDLDWLVSNQCVDLYVDSKNCQEKGCERRKEFERQKGGDGKHHYIKCQDDECEVESLTKVSSWLVG